MTPDTEEDRESLLRLYKARRATNVVRQMLRAEQRRSPSDVLAITAGLVPEFEPAGAPPRDLVDAQILAITARLARDLASAKGWTVAQTAFSFRDLTAGKPSNHHAVLAPVDEVLVDHAECFRARTRPYRPAAMLSHSYARDQTRHVAFARQHGLAVEFLPWSWYEPDLCLAALYVRI
ncbi:MAG: hypothetical protein ACTHU0_27920 [Kofleriaceae bacterium]